MVGNPTELQRPKDADWVSEDIVQSLVKHSLLFSISAARPTEKVGEHQASKAKEMLLPRSRLGMAPYFSKPSNYSPRMASMPCLITLSTLSCMEVDGTGCGCRTLTYREMRSSHEVLCRSGLPVVAQAETNAAVVVASDTTCKSRAFPDQNACSLARR